MAILMAHNSSISTQTTGSLMTSRAASLYFKDDTANIHDTRDLITDCDILLQKLNTSSPVRIASQGFFFTTLNLSIEHFHCMDSAAAEIDVSQQPTGRSASWIGSPVVLIDIYTFVPSTQTLDRILVLFLVCHILHQYIPVPNTIYMPYS